MLSRRNIRVKVMQMLYSMNRDKHLDYGQAIIQFREGIDISFELYLFNLLQFVRVAEYSQRDAARKMAKLLPSEEDKQFTAKLSENDLLQSIVQNEGFVRLTKKLKLVDRIDEDATRFIYLEFAKIDSYKDYIKQAESQYEDHGKILLALYKHCCNSERFNEVMEDNYPLWTDDKSLVVGALKKTIKALPAAEDFYENFRPTGETTKDFGEALLKNVHQKDRQLLDMIEPTLKNWDVDRVAVIDMILLKMALSELIHFPTIPTKVTLNEFVDISKMYSTEKSKDFINGILDRLLKKLHNEGKIKKEGRGLQE